MYEQKDVQKKSVAGPVRSGVLYSKTVRIHQVDDEALEEMWRLYATYYSDGTRSIFVHDFFEKDHVIVLRDTGDNSLQGFSTLHCFKTTIRNKPIMVLYSGDTIIDRRYWGQNSLQKAFFRYIVKCKLAHPVMPLYWFLISKGYKTYLLLSRNYPVYWPRYDKPTPSWEKELLDTLGTRKFGDEYLPDLGILRHKKCPGKLRESVAPIGDDLCDKYPDINFFANTNPHHDKGDELCCLGLIGPSMWTFYLRRLFSKTLSRSLSPVLARLSGRVLTEQSYRR